MAISLQKGQRISLEKNGASILKLCVGVNWGTIVKPGLRWGTNEEEVDLDASCALYDSSKNMKDIVYFGNLKSSPPMHPPGGILDNVDFARIPSDVNNAFSTGERYSLRAHSVRRRNGSPNSISPMTLRLAER